MFKRRNMTKLISNPNHSRHRSHSEVLSKVLILYNNISLHPTWHYFKIPHSFIGAQEPFLISDFFIKNCIKTVWICNVILISYLDKHVFPIWLSPVNFSLRKYRTWLFWRFEERRDHYKKYIQYWPTPDTVKNGTKCWLRLN